MAKGEVLDNGALAPAQRGGGSELTSFRRSLLKRQRLVSAMVTIGGGLLILATPLPWGAATYESGMVYLNGWDLHHAHWPPVALGYLAVASGVASIALARATVRRPAALVAAILPGGFASFLIWLLLRTGVQNLVESLNAFPGFVGVTPGIGFWMLCLGAGLVTLGSLAAAQMPMSRSEWSRAEASSVEPEPDQDIRVS